jgi:hypothetical protein
MMMRSKATQAETLYRDQVGPFRQHQERAMDDPTRRAERYRKVAAEYDDLADGAASPFFSM